MLRVDRLTAGYGATTVLREVTLVVPSGSVVALLGPNGAGKTTLLRTISGLLFPTAGSMTFDDEDVLGWEPNRRQRSGITLIPEGRGIFRNLSVRENILLFAAASGASDAVERAVDGFPRLGQRLHQMAGTLSGGEQQMLALSRAYIGRPRLVLLDEVSMGLAPVIVDEIFEFIGRLAATGVALLLVEQYVTRALAVADFTYFLDRGRVSFAGEPSELDEDEVARRYLAGA
jgi:branched-chain amino acid transport system ATP-binding protein